MKIVIIPHFYNIGGAGRYLSDLIIKLKKNNFTVVIDKYNDQFASDLSDEKMQRLSLPNYHGVAILKTFGFAIKLLFSLIIKRNLFSLIENNTYIFSSSIYLPSVYFYAKNNEGSRVICLIQENLKVNFFSKIILKNLPKNVHLIAITQSLCNKLKIYFPSISCLSNKFVNKDLYMGAKKYDLLYVGGEQKIKGFNLIKRITKSGSHNIKCIGFSNNYQTKLFEGYKENIIIHYQKAKILFCPITKYHFLRPAIEAGLVGVPFIITHLDGYTNVYGFDDFIYKGNNCETFKPKDKNSLTIAVKKILNNYEHYSVNARIVSGAFNKRWDIEISEFITKIK